MRWFEQKVDRTGGLSGPGPASSEKLNMLKSHEGLCYRVAFYLLGDEAEAIVAVRKTLMQLVRDDSFFMESSAEAQRQKAKRVAAIQALDVKRALLRERAGYAG